MLSAKVGTKILKNEVSTMNSKEQKSKIVSSSSYEVIRENPDLMKHFDSRQPRSQGPFSTSRKYPGCGWSRVYACQPKPHRGWILNLIL